MDGWMEGWMDGWMDEWMDGCVRDEECGCFVRVLSAQVGAMVPAVRSKVRGKYARSHVLTPDALLIPDQPG